MTDAPGMFSSGTRPKKKRNIGFIVVMSIAAVVVVGAIIGVWALARTEHPAPAGQQVEVRIPQGASSAQIAGMLSSYSVINNALEFQIRAKLADSSMRPGTYTFATGMPDELVLKRLAAGPQIVYYDIVIPEGFMAKQVAKRFAARAGVNEEEMMSLVTSGAPQFAKKHPAVANAYGGTLEGYLYPATYRIKKGTKPAEIVDMMLTKFDEATVGLDTSYAQSKGLTLNDVVTIASILEREAKLKKDYPTVASVIYNRLRIKQRLQLDSTVFYVAPEGTSRLSSTDLFIQSPYNTYRHAGLPPTPISNPGIEAMQSAAHPSNTPYFYYVLTSKDGSQTFTVTYKEFLQAVKKYHQVFGQ